MRRILLAVLAIWWAIFSQSVSAWAQPAEVSLRIIGINDFHGALVETDGYAGAAKLATEIESLREEAADSTILLAAGDMMQGTIESNLERGQTVIKIMNHLGVDAMTVGNHEFDWGLDALKNRVDEMTFSCLGANVLMRDTETVLSCLKPYTILERDGIKIGIVGLLTQDTITSVNPKNIATLRIAEPSEVAAEVIRTVRAEGADIVILLAHMACYQDETGRLIGEVTRLGDLDGIDVIVSGHSHTTINGKMNGKTVVQAGDKGRYLDVIDLVYSTGRRQIVSCDAKVRSVDAKSLTADPETERMIQEATQKVETIKQTEIGYLPQILVHDRRAVSSLGSWVADGILAATGADIALQNGGGVRSASLGRRVTAGDLYEMLPFDNTICTAHLSGEEIKAILEQGLFDEKHSILQYAGLTVVADEKKRRIISVHLSDGRLLENGKQYLVAYNDFMAAGGDGYPYLKDATDLTYTGIDLREAMVNYLHTAGDKTMIARRFFPIQTNEIREAA